MEKTTDKKAPVLTTIGKAATDCLALTEMELSVFCGLKGIESKDAYLKKIGKTEAQLSSFEKKELDKKWSPADLLQIFVDCKIAGINPASRDVYIMKYGDKPTLVFSYEIAIEKANIDDNYDGCRHGIIVIDKRSGGIVRRVGEWKLPDEELVAGWAEVYRKDRKYPEVSEVSWEEHKMNNAKKVWNDQLKQYDGEVQNEQWAKRGASMIAKVALNQAFKRAFPKYFGGYAQTDSEIRATVEEAQYTEVKETPVLQRVSEQPVDQPLPSEPIKPPADVTEEQLEQAAKSLLNDNPFEQ